jgi:hypothetical protein
MECQVFLCIFQKNSAMATLGLKEMKNFLWEGRGKGLPYWLSQFSKNKLGKLFSLPSQRNFSISFKPKVAIAKFIGKMQKKSGIMKSGLDTMPLFLLDNLLRVIFDQWSKLHLGLDSLINQKI